MTFLWHNLWLKAYADHVVGQLFTGLKVTAENLMTFFNEKCADLPLNLKPLEAVL